MGAPKRFAGGVRKAILFATAAVPVLLVLVLLRHTLQADRQHMLESRLGLQASLITAEVEAELESGRQIGHAILRVPAVRDLGPGCAAELRAMLQGLPAYQALSVIDAEGAVRCAATPAAATPPATPDAGFHVGTFMPAGAGFGPSLPFTLPFRAPDGSRAALVLNLSLEWLSAHLEAHVAAVDGATILADANGTILARAPDGAAFIGDPMPPGLFLPGNPKRPPAEHAADPRIVEAAGMGGEARLAALAQAAGGQVLVAVSLPMPGLLDGAGQLGWAGAGAVAGGMLLSLWLLLALNAWLERRAAAALLAAARRWSAGDLAARARLDELRDGEFARLAAAFNHMAGALGRQRAELLDLNATLEARVAERTRDLVASRNDLQREVVERERTGAELRQAQKLQAVGQLAGGIAHDFNNMLGTLTAALDLMRRRLALPPGPHPASEGRAPGQVSLAHLALAAPLDAAMQAARRGARLTAQLLAFARRQSLLPAPTDLNRLVADLPALVEGSLGRDIEIATHLAPGLWPAFVDPGQLEAALLNLVFNARDAMPGGGRLTLSTTNVMLPADLPTGPTLAPGAYVAVSVSDTGAGIAPEVLARVFEPFFTTRPAGSASGLGLSQVHGVVLQSGGDVRIETRPEAGTTVTLLLPRAEARAPTVLPNASLRPLRILVADDDDAVRRMTAEILLERGHQPVQAADATQALAILEKDLADTGGSFDVLLSDYVMPGTNGAALILMAQALQPRMKALLVTGHAEFGLAEALRPEHIMRKPFTIAELDARLAELMGEVKEAALF